MNPFFPICAVMSLLIFGYLSLIICPMTYLITQNAVHRCSRCLQTLGVKRCFGKPDDLSAPIWHIKLGKCALIIDRIYAILLLGSFAAFSVYYVYSRPYIPHHSFFDKPQQESLNITLSWNDYLESCSGERIIENQVFALHEFTQKYENNVVDWDGYYIDTKFKHREFSMFGNDHFMSILVKMDPSESENFADLVLSISQEGYRNHKNTLDNLQKGDHLTFKAKFKSMGNEFKLHHLHLLDGSPKDPQLFDTGHTKDLDHISIHESKLP
mmetsp:Transcript_13935/g.23699  ORF Transcript_13935/g.23699 Transcript_13935/m.23699 type:complete len:269 (-) Transcript_13935:27-833(-)